MSIIGGTTEAITGNAGQQSGADADKLNDDLNKFLNLLVTQLKNQDPLDPLDANEFTSQLVQFASVEQQIYQNANLEEMLALQQTSQASDMVNFIGTTIEAPGKKAPLENENMDFSYTLMENADTVVINITNPAGSTVFSTAGDAGAGTHKFTWDGKTGGGQSQPDGTYTINVVAVDSKGELSELQQTVFGRVTGASAENGDIQLYMGDIGVGMESVLSVTETKKAVN